MADQIALRIPESQVSAGSAVSVTANFRTRSTGAASTPSSIRYRVDCLTNQANVVNWTSVAAASSATITVGGTLNAIIDIDSDYETRQLLVELDTGLSTQTRHAIQWRVRNIKTYAPTVSFPDDLLLEPYYPLDALESSLTIEHYQYPVGHRFRYLDTFDVLDAHYYSITAAEIAAGVTPVSYQYEPGDVRRYGAVGDATTDDTTALQNALDVAGQTVGGTLKLPSSGYTFLCTANLDVPVGIGTAVDIEGSSWTAGGIKFSGASVTTGLTFTGSSYSYCGEVRNLRIYCVSSAARGITFSDVNHPRVTRCAIHGAAGAGVKYDGTLMGELNHTLVISCGSATEGSVEVDGSAVTSTTFRWHHSRISGGNTTVGGLLIDRTSIFEVIGGNIESSGVPIKVASKSEGTTGCIGGIIKGIDLEAPGQHYIELGYGWTGSASLAARSITIEDIFGTVSGATDVRYGIKLDETTGVEIRNVNLGLTGASIVSSFYLEGSNNVGTIVRTNRRQNGNAFAWVYVNSAQVKQAGPLVDWFQAQIHEGYGASKTVSGTTASVMVNTTQGGHHRILTTNNGSATNWATLTDGALGMEILIRCNDANTTLVHGTGADEFNFSGAADLVLTNGEWYRFVHNGTGWKRQT